ncbi:hypothetical protein [Antrihabitans spumae]|uniref:GNAT family N-acetyltransferase n=1 Tax=Antrihabitans spumae TaxID=3373370 RepID=A0ABW7KU58_9NOCA
MSESLASYRLTPQTLFVVTTPTESPQLWTEYLAGALAGYRRFDVEAALNLDQIRDGTTSIRFAAAVDSSGTVVGGVRYALYESAETASAVLMWNGYEGRDDLYRLVKSRIDEGIVESKAAFVSPDSPDRREIARAIGRAGAVVPMVTTQARWALGVAGDDHAIAHWQSAGSIKEPADLPGAPYPDARYHATPLWWDRTTYLDNPLADPVQRELIRSEAAQLASAFGAAGRNR